MAPVFLARRLVTPASGPRPPPTHREAVSVTAAPLARQERSSACVQLLAATPTRSPSRRCNVTGFDQRAPDHPRGPRPPAARWTASPTANAGFGIGRGFQTGDVEIWRSMVLTNVYGCALTIRATMDALEASSQACAADRLGQPVVTSESPVRLRPTKSAVTAIGRSEHQEYNGTGVRVTLIEPGMVDTPFFDNKPSSPAFGSGRDHPGGGVRRRAAGACGREQDG